MGMQPTDNSFYFPLKSSTDSSLVPTDGDAIVFSRTIAQARLLLPST